MATEQSKILVIGGTGYIGKFIVEGSAKSGHQTFALVRESSLSDPVKGKIVQNFKDLGVTILYVRFLVSKFYQTSRSMICISQPYVIRRET